MKAIVRCDYGGAEVVQCVDVEKPAPADDQILVKVHAAAVNPLDWHMMRGTPYLMRISSGISKPNSIRLGIDYSGTVEAAGSSVSGFRIGDPVFGGALGSLAEYVVVSANRGAVLKPANLTFEQAAAVNVAGRTALQALQHKAQVQPGQTVLINGASGGVGTFAIQIAKAFGAEVTGVQSTRNVELVRSLGADDVIDYTKNDFRTGGRFDVVIDNVGNCSMSEIRGLVKPRGSYVLIGAGGPADRRWAGPLVRIVQMAVFSPFVSHRMGVLMVKSDPDDLRTLAGLLEAGKVKPVIDRQYSLAEAGDAIRYLESGRARGKVIVAC